MAGKRMDFHFAVRYEIKPSESAKTWPRHIGTLIGPKKKFQCSFSGTTFFFKIFFGHSLTMILRVGEQTYFNISWWSFVRIWFWNNFQRQHIYTSSWNPYLPIRSWAAQKDPLHDVSNQVLARGKKSKFSKQDDPKFTHLLGLSQLFDHRSMIFTTDPVIAIGGHLLG